MQIKNSTSHSSNLKQMCSEHHIALEKKSNKDLDLSNSTTFRPIYSCETIPLTLVTFKFFTIFHKVIQIGVWEVSSALDTGESIWNSNTSVKI